MFFQNLSCFQGVVEFVAPTEDIRAIKIGYRLYQVLVRHGSSYIFDRNISVHTETPRGIYSALLDARGV